MNKTALLLPFISGCTFQLDADAPVYGEVNLCLEETEAVRTMREVTRLFLYNNLCEDTESGLKELFGDQTELLYPNGDSIHLVREGIGDYIMYTVELNREGAYRANRDSMCKL